MSMKKEVDRVQSDLSCWGFGSGYWCGYWCLDDGFSISLVLL